MLATRSEPSANIVKTLETLPTGKALDITNMKADFTGASGVPSTGITFAISVTLNDRIGTKQITGFMTLGNLTNEVVLLALLDEIISKYPNASFKFGGTIPDLPNAIKEKISVMLDEIYVKKNNAKPDKLEIPAIPEINTPGEYIKSKSVFIILLPNQEEVPVIPDLSRVTPSLVSGVQQPTPQATSTLQFNPADIQQTVRVASPASSLESFDDIFGSPSPAQPLAAASRPDPMAEVNAALGETFDINRVNIARSTRANRYYTLEQLSSIANALTGSSYGTKPIIVGMIVQRYNALTAVHPDPMSGVNAALGETFDINRVNVARSTRTNRYYTVPQLKIIAGVLAGDTAGNKQTLVERITRVYNVLTGNGRRNGVDISRSDSIGLSDSFF